MLDGISVSIWNDETGFYWQRSGEKYIAGPFQTRGSAKHDAGVQLYMEAGKDGIRFLE